MGFRLTARAREAARGAGALRVEVRPGPQYARPLPIDVFFEDAPPRDHLAVDAQGVTVWVPAHLGWIADNDVQIDAAADGHLEGTIASVRRPW